MKGQQPVIIELKCNDGETRKMTFKQIAEYMESISMEECNTYNAIYGRWRKRADYTPTLTARQIAGLDALPGDPFTRYSHKKKKVDKSVINKQLRKRLSTTDHQPLTASGWSV